MLARAGSGQSAGDVELSLREASAASEESKTQNPKSEVEEFVVLRRGVFVDVVAKLFRATDTDATQCWLSFVDTANVRKGELLCDSKLATSWDEVLVSLSHITSWREKGAMTGQDRS